MFSGAWKESSRQNPAVLEAAHDGIFPHFLDWLYFRRIPVLGDHLVGSPTCGNCGGLCADIALHETRFEFDNLTSEDNSQLDRLVHTVTSSNVWTHLYIFADRFDVPSLRELIINTIWQCFVPVGYALTYIDIVLASKSLPVSSPLCRLYVDIFTATWNAQDDQICPVEQKLRAKVPANFYFIVAAKAREGMAGARIELIGAICSYHEHANDDAAKVLCKGRLESLRMNHTEGYQDWDEMEKMRAARFRQPDAS